MIERGGGEEALVREVRGQETADGRKGALYGKVYYIVSVLWHKEGYGLFNAPFLHIKCKSLEPTLPESFRLLLRLAHQRTECANHLVRSTLPVANHVP